MGGPERVSVVMPIYNGARHCVEALASVFAQTRLPDEVIVIDDGSDDLSVELLQAMDAPVPVKIERQTNQGQSAARNAGIRLVTGSMVAFLDQDDLWTPDHLERLCGALERDPTVAWAFGDFDEIDDGGRVVTRAYLAHHGVHTARTSLGELLAADLMVLPSASVIRRDALEAVGGFDPDLSGYEDDDLFIRMFRAGYRSVCVPLPLTAYRVHAAGSSSTDAFRRSRVRFLAKMHGLLPDHVRPNRYWVQDYLYPRLFDATLLEYAAMLRAGDRAEARALADTATELSRVVGANGRRRRVLLFTLRHPRLLRLVATGARVIPYRWRPHASGGSRAVLIAAGLRLPSA
jgi:glycosyltransferase involved in cell wall biosynthesis